MIILYHQDTMFLSAWDFSKDKEVSVNAIFIAEALVEIAKLYSDKLLVWCHISQKENLNLPYFSQLFHHKKIMASYSPQNYLQDALGYVDESPFIKTNKSCLYPTWRMSSLVGGINSDALSALNVAVKANETFDYFLNSLAKIMMPHGLFCYSDPKLLLKPQSEISDKSTSNTILFRFVKQHYSTKWLYILFISLFIYERKIAFWPFLKALFYTQKNYDFKKFIALQTKSQKLIASDRSIDVVIPTIGRKIFLYDFLRDLSHQTLLPKRVIIVEQNPDLESSTALDFLENEKWTFLIKHYFTHQQGVCNARNVALESIENNWIFLADDDIRISTDFLEKAFDAISLTGNEAYSFACLTEPNKPAKFNLGQTTLFSSGCSIISKKALGSSRFSSSFEFGFGEDSDFGMQLRNKGIDVIFGISPQALHLKAPIGGFRTKPILLWQDDEIKPKPSPTVMLYKILHHSKEQLLGYKTILFLKYYKQQSIKNPFRYYKKFQKQWKRSVYWATVLQQNKGNI